MKRNTTRAAPLLLALTLWGALPESAHAACLGLDIPPPSDLNICRELADDLVVPLLEEHLSCGIGWPECLAIGCCDGICYTNPICPVVKKTVQIGTYIYYAGDVYCDVEEISAQEMLEDLAQQSLSAVETLATGGVNSMLYQFAGVHLDVLACSGDPIPSALRAAIRELIREIPDPDVADIDINRTDLLAESDGGDIYLVSPRSAITLDTLVILRDRYFNAARGFTDTWEDVLNEDITAEEEYVMLLLIHELTHVRQYREMGRVSFVNNYLSDTLVNGYSSAATEREAEGFEERAAEELDRRRADWQSTILNTGSTLM